MNLNKTPGPDGLTVEFYRAFFPILGPTFLKLIQQIYEIDHLAESQNLSYITVIPKGPGKQTDMKNVRPISLLNTDYKIIAKTLANKLKPYLPTIINPDQTCSIQNRTIEQHTNLLRDFIEYNNQTQTHAIILSIDQEKAFDRLAHSYLHNSLISNNIGTYFRKWIRILYSNPSVTVKR